MSLLNALQQQANALDDYENRYNNAMNNFDVEKQIYKQTDIAYKQGKQLANQIFTGQQLENLNLAVPAVYELTKGAYGRYRAGKSIIPSREEVTQAVKNFGRGKFRQGAKATVDKLKGALPKDMADAYDAKYNGKLPENLDELQDHVNTLKDLATNKISETAKEVSAPVAEGAADIARRATGRAAPPPDTQASRPLASAEERARPLGPETAEGPRAALPADFTPDASSGGPGLVSPETLSLQSFHNSNVRQFEGFPDSVKDIIVDRMQRMGVEDAETGGALDPNKLQIHSDILSQAASEFGLPKASGLGGAPRSRGFNADLFYDPSEGVLKDRNTGEQVRDIARLGADDLTPSQQYQQRSPEEDDRIFDNPNSTLSRVLPFTDPDVPQPTIRRGAPPAPTEEQARQSRLAEDPASFVPEEAFRAPVRPPPDTQASRPFSTAEERARPLGPEPAEAPPLAPPREVPGVDPFDRTEDRLVRLGADRPEEQPQQSNEEFFRGLRVPDSLRLPPPPPRETEALATAGGRTADIEDTAARRELRGPYGSTAEQAQGTAPTPAPTARPAATPVTEEIQQRLRQGDVDRGLVRASAEDAVAKAQKVVPEEPKEDVEVKTSEVTAEDAGGAAGGVAAIGEGILTATDKGLTPGEKTTAIAKEVAPLAAFAAGGPIAGGLTAGAEILSSGESGAQKVKQLGVMGGALGGAAAASAVIPGAGELILGAIGIGSLIKDAVERHEQNKEMEHNVPAPPRAPQMPGIAFDSAPVIDSSDFHAL